MGDAQEPSFTAEEYIEGLEEADAVLGCADPDKCTYENGYMPRQAVFSCLTCAQAVKESRRLSGASAEDPDDTPQAAGVCVECAVTCHKDHETVELWTKRNFRCDCGNSKFGQVNKCQLCPTKDPVNDKNVYNQNYEGLYCSCHKPYPDPAREDDYDMVMCIACEDWFHEEHLGLPEDLEMPSGSELLCPQCVADKCTFVLLYAGLLLSPEPPDQQSEDPPSEPAAQAEASPPCPAPSAEAGSEPACSREPQDDAPTAGGPPTADSPADPLPGTAESNSTRCKVESLGMGSASHAVQRVKTLLAMAQAGSEAREGLSERPVVSGAANPTAEDWRGRPPLAASLPEPTKWQPGWAAFPALGWREAICRCESCLSHYAASGVPFAADPEDSLAAYEQRSKKRREEQAQAAEAELQQRVQRLGHVGQLELAYGIQEFKAQMAGFLEQFKGTDRVIQAADVHSFFDGLKSKRRRI